MHKIEKVDHGYALVLENESSIERVYFENIYQVAEYIRRFEKSFTSLAIEKTKTLINFKEDLRNGSSN